jgi:hypothetical protein
MEKNQNVGLVNSSEQTKNKSRADGLIVNSPVTANSQSNVGYCDSSGAPPSNTAPPNCIGDSTSILHTGIDSLYLSFQGRLHLPIAKELERLKLLAQSADEREKSKAVLHLGNHHFYVKPTGKGRFSFVLADNWFHIQLAASTAKSLPMAYVQISSEVITIGGLHNVLPELDHLISLIGECRFESAVSRADICVDFSTGVDFTQIQRLAWVSRSNAFHQYFDGKVLTGYVFGEGGDLSCRLYNKTKEIEKSKKTYCHPIWSFNGWNEEQTIWRLEFQFRRTVLKDLRIHSVNDLQTNLDGLWEYCTKLWLKLTLPSKSDTTQSRWPLHPLWKHLQTVQWNHGNEPFESLSRVRKTRLPNNEFLYKNCLAGITSFMAIHSIESFDEAAKLYLQKAHEFHSHYAPSSQKTLNTYARDKAKEKARRYNIAAKE